MPLHTIFVIFIQVFGKGKFPCGNFVLCYKTKLNPEATSVHSCVYFGCQTMSLFCLI